MRPDVLFSLFSPVTELAGVGPRIAKLVERAAGGRVVDLIWHLPTGVIDRRYAPDLASAIPGRVATLTLKVLAHDVPRVARRPYRVFCSDDGGEIELVFFHAKEDYLRRQLPEGEVRLVSGRVEMYRDALQMTHPDRIGGLDERAAMMTVEPVYPLTEGLTLKTLGKAVEGALARLPELAEWIDPPLVAKRDWPAWREAICRAHAPEGTDDLVAGRPERERLAYDELLAGQVALLLLRARMRKRKGRAITGDGALRARVMAALPFELTGAQRNAMAEIDADMALPERMLRLLQGDVGSGKTVVALFAMLNAVEAGGQAALMAPTEVLARQHHKTILPLAEAAGIEIALLTGRNKGRARQALLDGLADGRTAIAIGTHALFQDDVAFKDLMMAVVDEQHRFGVHQRLLLAQKGAAVDLLVTTATPIPRTLMLAAYGDMDNSRLDEKPAGRLPIATKALAQDRLGDVLAAVRRAVAAGAKAYWVCPLVEESEALDLAAAEARYTELKQVFGDRVGLVHGRMKPAEKDAAMAGFAGDAHDVLVATTVIEVGVDVPAATVMVIEHAERFGLAQLHQLRGRVGRSDAASSCLLIYQAPLSETARARLGILRETEDGFIIAEEDLRLRGGGEVLGTRQSGLPGFRLADLAVHADLLPVARDDARLALERDPDLQTPRGQALRNLLYLFERDAVARSLGSG